jgi:4-aminobutyrate aminotransferase-like enzyme
MATQTTGETGGWRNSPAGWKYFCMPADDANENAIKLARSFTGRHNPGPLRSYHGATAGAWP